MDNEIDDNPRDKEDDTAGRDTDVEQTLETFTRYSLTCSKFAATVTVRQLLSKGLSFQLWQAANAVCWYIENEFGEEGMLVPASAVDDCSAWILGRHFAPGEDSTADGGQTKKLPEKCEARLAGVLEGMRRSLCGRDSDDQYHSPRRMRVIELGAGTGLVGIVAACLGADVVLTDLPHVIPNVSYNLEMNKDIIRVAGGSVEARVLRWGVEEDVEALGELSFDLILASDCVYYDTAYKPFLQTLKWLMARDVDGSASNDNKSINPSLWSVVPQQPVIPTVSALLPNNPSSLAPVPTSQSGHAFKVYGKQSESEIETLGGLDSKGPLAANLRKVRRSAAPLIFLGHLRRWAKDRRFFRMASKCFDVQIVHRHPPEENVRTGPLVYRLTARSNCGFSGKSSPIAHHLGNDE